MKYIAPIAAMAMTVATAQAGTLTEPVVEEVMEPEMEAAGSSSGGILVPLLLLGVVAAVIASSGDDDEVDTNSSTTVGPIMTTPGA